jgi:hypothetical protein
MKTFRDLYIYLNGMNVDIFIQKLGDQTNPIWSRNKDKEEIMDGKEQFLCFEAIQNDRVQPVALFLFPDNDNTVWKVSNIIPTQKNELTHDEYNAALMDFHEQIIQPAIQNTSITIELTSDIVTITSVAGIDVENALKRFSKLANKSTGASHPADQKRWFEFLTLAYHASNKLDVDLVITTLEELGWSGERAIELGLQFEFAQSLLSYVQE